MCWSETEITKMNCIILFVHGVLQNILATITSLLMMMMMTSLLELLDNVGRQF